MACTAVTSTQNTATAMYGGEKTLTEDGRKIVEEKEVEGVNASFANIMANHRPNPWGKGHLQLYALATICFLNSTMSGTSSSHMSQAFEGPKDEEDS